MHMHRVNTAPNLVRTSSPRTRPEFRDNCGLIVEEKDKMGRVLARYKCGALLGRGGFAKCFEFTNVDTGAISAAKVIERSSLSKPKTLQKLHSEIAIHRRMKHKNIVEFQKTFQDDHYVYLLLEKCVNQTLMEVSKTRRRFSIPETQFLMTQILSAVQYMHDNNVIHRDLKLGNFMLDENMNVKIGDFGLAAELQYDGERKRTICGTPNYIAPEILDGAREGHSFEVDVWSIGVIFYTFLVGKPPFETADVKTTYNRIKMCKYAFPPGVDLPESGKALVHRILQSQPTKRPTLIDIRADPFFRNPVPPTEAPSSLFPATSRRYLRERDANAMAPPKDDVRKAPLVNLGDPKPQATHRRSSSPRDSGAAVPVPTLGVAGVLGNRHAPNHLYTESGALSHRARTGSLPPPQRNLGSQPVRAAWDAPTSSSNAIPSSAAATKKDQSPRRSESATAAAAAPAKGALSPKQRVEDEEERHQFTAIHDKLHQTFVGGHVDDDRGGATLAPPKVWVTDYADFSSRYGLSYRLNTGHTGVHYNDSTKMVWEPITSRVEYLARVKEVHNGVTVAQDSKSSFHMDSFPETLNKKVTLIKYFKNYLAKGRGKKDVEVVACSPFVSTDPVLLTEPHMITDMVYVKRWLLTKQAMIFRLSNKTIQVCFFDNTEVILSSEARVVTFTDTSGRRRTLPLSAVASQNDEVASRLRYTKDILCRLINNKEL